MSVSFRSQRTCKRLRVRLKNRRVIGGLTRDGSIEWQFVRVENKQRLAEHIRLSGEALAAMVCIAEHLWKMQDQVSGDVPVLYGQKSFLQTMAKLTGDLAKSGLGTLPASCPHSTAGWCPDCSASLYVLYTNLQKAAKTVSEALQKAHEELLAYGPLDGDDENYAKPLRLAAKLNLLPETTNPTQPPKEENPA